MFRRSFKSFSHASRVKPRLSLQTRSGTPTSPISESPRSKGQHFSFPSIINNESNKIQSKIRHHQKNPLVEEKFSDSKKFIKNYIDAIETELEKIEQEKISQGELFDREKEYKKLILQKPIADQKARGFQDEWDVIDISKLIGIHLVQTASHGEENIIQIDKEEHVSNSAYFSDSRLVMQSNGHTHAKSKSTESKLDTIDEHMASLTQVDPHQDHGLRQNYIVYEIRPEFENAIKSIKIPVAICKANPKAGVGGAPQYYLTPELRKLLIPRKVVDQNKNGHKGVGDVYFDKKDKKYKVHFPKAHQNRNYHDLIIVGQCGTAIIHRSTLWKNTRIDEIKEPQNHHGLDIKKK